MPKEVIDISICLDKKNYNESDCREDQRTVCDNKMIISKSVSSILEAEHREVIAGMGNVFANTESGGV